MAVPERVRLILLFLLFQLLLPAGLGAQADFAPIGAKWIYKRCYMVTCTGEVHEVVRDTVIDGMGCSVLERTLYGTNGAQYILDEWVLCQEGARVYHYLDTISYLLYDFDAQPGDSWPIRLYDSFFEELISMQAWLHIDSLGTLNANGEIFDVQYTSIETENPLGPFTGWDSGSAIRDVGSFGYILPVFYSDQCCLRYNLYCFESPGLYFESPVIPPGSNCLTPLAAKETSGEAGLQVYPNPASELVFIDYPEGNKLDAMAAFRADGSLFRFFEAPLPGTITVLDWPAGLYWLKIIGAAGFEVKKIIVAR